MKDFYYWILLGLLCSFMFIMGWLGNAFYTEYDTKMQIAGLWFGNQNWNYTSVQEKSQELDNSGQWICINVNKDLKYDEIVETCSHEAGHELFARKCADKPEVCFKLEQELENGK